MQEIFEAIDQYASAYARLERIQRSRPLEIPIGDQKTGVIAEFFARIYARHRFPEAVLEFGSASEHAWDIKVLRPGQPELKVQVKAVSAHSQTSRVSPIHPGWHQLWLMRLDEHLRPHALWVIEAKTAPWSNTVLKNRTMPKLGKPQSGSAELRAGTNETTPFLATLLTANPSFHQTRVKSRAGL
ncbi:MAG: hypothetical protein AB1720_09280 [Pseudomonadota bacterium]